ncbi:MAG: peptidoglycan DD-metalloendopeptidase family protein [Thermoflexales bacterium]|nr:peptidoglycan DD-metalloendopeptidase family protein [Thermoflexales bacterium]
MDRASAPLRNGAQLTQWLSRLTVLAWRLSSDEARQIIHRYLVHLAVLALALAAVLLGGGQERQAEAGAVLSYNVRALANEAVTAEQPPGPTPYAIGGASRPYTTSAASDIEVIQRRALPYTDSPQRTRLETITYTVQPGDTTQGIAIIYDLEDTTVMWCNPEIEDMPDFLRIGQEVVIPPIDGVCHTVKEGDNLESIAAKYKVDVSAITGVSYNNLIVPGYAIQTGQRLIVAGGQKPYVPKIVTSYTGSVPEGARGTGLFQWPTVGGITQDFWWGHRAIDIGAYTGAEIRAADGGFVSFAGWTDIGYGYLIVVDHANGFSSYYAHCSGFYVSAGEAVSRGQLIGAVGSTGNSTGPHVHFEIRYYGSPLNPRGYLP